LVIVICVPGTHPLVTFIVIIGIAGEVEVFIICREVEEGEVRVRVREREGGRGKRVRERGGGTG
jgi:flavoprotein